MVDNRGDPIQGLNPSNFKGEFRGKPVRVAAARFVEEPRRVVVLLDISGSMLEEGKWEIAFELASDIVMSVPSLNPIGLITFSEKIEDRIDFAADRTPLLARLQQLDSERRNRQGKTHRTAYRDAIVQGLAMFGPSSFGDVIYIISDGVDNSSKSGRSDVQRALLSAGVRLFALALNDVNFKPIGFEVAVGIRELSTIVVSSGGVFLLTPAEVRGPAFSPRYFYEVARKEAAQSLPYLYAHMTSFYQLEIELPQPAGKPGSWKLELLDGGPINKKLTKLSYRRELLSCQASDPPH